MVNKKIIIEHHMVKGEINTLNVCPFRFYLHFENY